MSERRNKLLTSYPEKKKKRLLLFRGTRNSVPEEYLGKMIMEPLSEVTITTHCVLNT